LIQLKVVVVGAGEVGYTVAKSLSQQGHDVTLVEKDEMRASKVENELDVMVVRGNGSKR
jgi:trk system potassium uptake protein TrkA